MRIDGYEVNDGHVIAVFITDKKRNIKEHKYEPARPRGKWELYKDDDYSGGGYILCTACKYRFSFGAYKILEDDNYCPRCGAKIIRRPDPNTITFTFDIYKKEPEK